MARKFGTAILLPADPTSALQAATKQYVDNGFQPLDSDLTTIAAMSPADGTMIRRESGIWVAKTMAQVKTALVLAKADVGLGSVDNTADSAKPVSTAQQTALDGKLTPSDARHGGATVGGATSVNTASITYVSLGSDDLAVTFTWPPSGRVTFMVRSSISCSSTTLNHFGLVTIEARDTNSSGTVRLAASDDSAVFGQSITAAESVGTSCAFVTYSGFPTSGAAYVRALYRSTNAANTATFAYRSLSVIPSP